MNRRLVPFLALAALGSAPAALAQHGPPPAPAGKSASLQGDTEKFINNDYIRRFYALSVSTLKGADHPDLDAYEQKSYAIFREFGTYMGVGPEHMQDHLKLIPRQVAQIAKEDPHILDTFDTFTEAMVGPK
ncbi:MAG: hypothetical protein ACXWKT_19520 [Caulobacteraceae bacterium]